MPTPTSPKVAPELSSYHRTMVSATRYGAFIGTALEVFFVIFYGLSGYPWQAVLFNLCAAAFSLTALIILRRTHRSFIPAHLITVGVYLSLIGPGLYTGGIDSSSMFWILLVPVISALMSGKKAGVVWAGICLATALGIFFLNRVLLIDISVRPSTSTDRIIDLSLVIFVILMTTWLNETTKQRAMTELENAQINLEKLAHLDPLTGIFNRRYFLSHTQQHLDQAQAVPADVSVLVIDIDHFKIFNDTYGHEAGDQILCSVVNACSANLRDMDILSRFGGEEFVAFLPQTNPEDAHKVAERLRETVERISIQTDFGILKTTISIGIISCPMNRTLYIQRLIHQADAAMYQAKRLGRNQVAVWQEAFPTFPFLATQAVDQPGDTDHPAAQPLSSQLPLF